MTEPWLARVIRSCTEKAIAGSAHHDEMVKIYLEQHPEMCIVSANIPGFNFGESTVAELRATGVDLCREADRIESLEAKGPVHVLRELGKVCATDFVFCDKDEKDVRHWILSRIGMYSGKGVLLYREWWADDPTTGKKRVVKRELVGDPIKEAQENIL